MKKHSFIFVFMLLTASACADYKPKPWDGESISKPRAKLTIDQLSGNEVLPLLDMSFFIKPSWAEHSTHPFSGEITFTEKTIDMKVDRELRVAEDQFPAFSIRFISDNGALIPEKRDLINTIANTLFDWDVIVGTGSVWHEPNDGEWNRASFPLTLTDRYVGAARNCIASFAYTSNRMSNVYLQCSQETADIDDKQIYNSRVMIPATYKPEQLANKMVIVDNHRRLISRRIFHKPLRQIDRDGAIAHYFNKSIWSNASTSIGALYVDDTLYINPPNTRHGPYPYPNEMRHGVFSVTKSLVGAVSMFYFAQRYGADIFDAHITDYVPALSTLPEWKGVTFSHALNMVTGTGGSDAYDMLFHPVMSAPTAEAAINKIAQFGDGRGKPGQVYNYVTSNFFVLSYALQRYVEKKEGNTIQFWDLIRENVLSPIGVEDFDILHTKEQDPSDRIPTLGYGARPTLDNAAKIARLIANEGEFNGTQILHQQSIREALGRTSWQGYKIDRDKRYRHSFWSKVYKTAKCDIHVSYMQGFGSNHIIFLPSGIIIFRFMDEFDRDFSPLVKASERLKSSC